MTYDEAFKLLDCPPEASVAMVKTCYRVRAAKAHPDAGGADEAFALLLRAKALCLRVAENRKCIQCEGLGTVTQGLGFQQLKIQCPACAGTGKAERP